ERADQRHEHENEAADRRAPERGERDTPEIRAGQRHEGRREREGISDAVDGLAPLDDGPGALEWEVRDIRIGTNSERDERLVGEREDDGEKDKSADALAPRGFPRA